MRLQTTTAIITTLGQLLVLTPLEVFATQKEISRELDPYDAERFLYSVSQTIQAPGMVDLSHLVFSNMKQYYYVQTTDDDAYNAYNNNENINNGEEPYNKMELEVALLYCGSTTKNSDYNTICNLQQLGIGKYSQEDGIHYRCCTADAMTAGVCEEEGRLVVDAEIFSGQWFDVVAGNNSSTYIIDSPIRTVEQSGVYMVVLANCNQYGIPILTKGRMGFRSRYGYLPASAWRCSWISHMFTIMSAGALVWLYRHYSRRKVDTVFLITVALTFVQSFVLSLYYLKYNKTGIMPDALYHVHLYVNAFASSMANVSMVLAAFGWDCLTKVYKAVPMHTICVLGTLSAIILSLIASWNEQYTLIVGQFLSILFALWALQVNATTLHMLRPKNEELFRRWAFMRALFVFSICQGCILCAIYLGVARNSNSNRQEACLIIQRFALLFELGVLAHLIRPHNEMLLSGKDGMDTTNRESDHSQRGIDP